MRGTNREEVLAALNMSAGQAEREVLAALVALDEFRHLPEDVSLLRDNFSHKQKCPDIGIDRLVFRRIFIVICPIPLKQNGAFIRPLIQQSNPHRMNHIRIKIVPDTNRIQPIGFLQDSLFLPHSRRNRLTFRGPTAEAAHSEFR